MDEQLLQYFMDQTNARLERIEAKQDQLLEFKWKAAGGLAVFNIVVLAAIQIVFGK
jgi:NADH:ubiquinone oxidoreductase subunit H